MCCGLCLSTMAAADTAPPLSDVVEGLASFYGGKFHGRKTSSGERYDKMALTAATNRFPIGSLLAVQRPASGHCVVVRVNDRMHGRHKLRIVDLSKAAAKSLDMLRAGVVKVRVAPIDADLVARTPQACAEAFVAPVPAAVEAAGEAGELGYNPGAVMLRQETGLSTP